MQSDNPILDDIAKLASGAAGALNSMRQEVEAAVKARVERLASEMDLVPREDFDAVKKMAEKARAENIELRERIEKLEKSILKK